MSTPAAIEINNLSFSYGKKSVLDNFNLSIEYGKTYCLVGSSGSGKTTALRLINGLLKPNSGDVYLEAKKLDFAHSEKIRRTMGYSIQGSGLFPHMTLYENLTIIAKKEGWNKERLQDRVYELCELMSLPKDESFLKKKPRQISGGQQQRVGIARALFMKPKIMLMDEPFSALDPITRSELQTEFVKLQEKLHLTIVLVTHDLSEAFQMADEIVLLNKGQVEQKGKPSRFLLYPESDYVRSFIDSHSPGNILKEVYLYSVVNSDIYTSEFISSKMVLKNIDNDKILEYPSINDSEEFLKSIGQGAHYWVSNNNFVSSQEFGQEKINNSIQSRSHILNGMQALLKSKSTALPVVDSNNNIIGVFSEEAINAL